MKPISFILTVDQARIGTRTGVSKGAELKDLLRRQATEARDRALDNDGQISAEETDPLERLARLVEIAEQTEEPSKRPRWPVAAVLALTLSVMSGLLFLRVPSTNVVIDLKVDEVELVVPQSQTLNEPIPLVELGAAGLASLRMRRSKDSSGQVHSAADKTWSRIQLSVPEPGQGRMTLDPLTPAADTRIWLRKTRLPDQYGLSLQHQEIVITLTLSGWLTLRSLEASNASNFKRDFGRGKAMHLTGREKVVDIAMTIAGDARASFARVIPVSALTLLKAHQDTVGQTRVEESTIRAGTIYFSDLDDKSQSLRAGEMLRLEVSEGHLRALSLAEDHVALSFHGKITELTIGEGRGRRSLMPTYLEWMSAHHALSLLWAAAMYIFGLALAILRWWRTVV